MKRLLSMAIVIVMLIGIIQFPSIAKTEQKTYCDENFETGTYTVVTNDANDIKELYKEGVLQWTFAKKSGATFANTFPAELVSDVTADTSVPLNGSTRALTTTADAPLADNTIAYMNLPEKVTTGTVTISFRMKRPATNTDTTFIANSEAISGYTSSFSPVSQFNYSTNSSSRGRIRLQNCFVDEETVNGSGDINDDSGTKMKGWPWIKLVYNIDEKTVNFSYSVKSADAMKEVGAFGFYALGDKTYTVADGISSLVFTGEGLMGIDDMKVEYTTAPVLPVAQMSLTGKAIIGETLTGTYLSYSHGLEIPEAQSACTWYRADNYDLTTAYEVIKTENISVGESSTYTITEDDEGKFIAFAITPVSTEDVDSVGEEVYEFAEGGAVRPYYENPFVTLDSPSSGDYIYTKDGVKFTASAMCDSSAVTKVEYYVGDKMIASSDTAPYSAETILDAGKYSIFARAYNANGGYTDSEPANITVTSMRAVEFYQEDGVSPLSNTVTAYDGIVAKVDVANSSEDVMHPTLVVGAYEGDKLIGIACSNSATIEPDGAQTLSVSMPIDNYQRTKMDKFRAFVWNIDTYENYCEPTQFDKKPIKILTIGNSFANNAATYIRSIGAKDGENIIVGKANISNSGFSNHTRNYREQRAVYALSVTGRTFDSKLTVQQCMEAEKWDFITIQQVSFKSHVYDTYLPEMETLAGYIKQHAPQAKVIIHQTWAYTEKCSRLSDPTDSKYKEWFKGMTQADMFAGIEDASKRGAELLDCRIFPAGKAFQLVRAVKPDSTFDTVGAFLNNNDGYHANDKGKFLAGAVFYECMTGNSMLENTYKLSGISNESMEIMRQAAHEAAVEYGWIN